MALDHDFTIQTDKFIPGIGLFHNKLLTQKKI